MKFFKRGIYRAKAKSKNRLIKAMGGYTRYEHLKLIKDFEDRIGNNWTSQSELNYTANTAIYETLNKIELFAKSLYGIEPEKWAEQMFAMIHANKLRLITQYLMSSSSVYKVDTNLIDNGRILESISKEDASHIIKPITKQEILEELDKIKTEEFDDEDVEEKIMNFLENIEDIS